MTATQKSQNAKNDKTTKSSQSSEKPVPTTAPSPYREGAFVWFEVRTPNPEKAAKFFGDVVGWDISQMEMGPGMKYTLASTTSGNVAGIVKADKAELISYVSVDDVDAAAKRVAKAGGKVKGQAFDIPTVGRMVEVESPEGAPFFLFRGEKGDVTLAPAAGHFLWNELWTNDAKRSVAFLTSVFGYSVDAQEMMGTTYHVL